MDILTTRAPKKRLRITQFCCYKGFNLEKREGKLGQIFSNYIYIRNLHLKTESRVQNEWKNFFKQGRHVFLNTLRTGDADLRFYITTVQDG